MIACNIHSHGIMALNVDDKFDGAIVTESNANTVLQRVQRRPMPGLAVGPTRLYRITSSQFTLTNGIMPSRWEINSSGNTVVFSVISTRSMAGNYWTLNGSTSSHEPTVGISAIMTLRKEFAYDRSTFSSTKLTRSCFSERIRTMGSSDMRVLDKVITMSQQHAWNELA